MSSEETEPFLVIVGGPNGSGKSTLTRQLVQSSVDFGEYINPDDIAAELAAELNSACNERVRAAQKIADERRAEAISAKRSFPFETVMSHPSKLDVLRDAKAAGFHVEMFFVATDTPEINIKRVAGRVAKGGHDGPTDKIIERYERTLALLPQALMICDRAVRFDNSGTSILPWLSLERAEAGAAMVYRTVADGKPRPAWSPITEIGSTLEQTMTLVEWQNAKRWQNRAD